MNIRTLLLSISVVGAISSASVVLFFMDEKISVQEEANNSLQISSYRETWDRLIGSDKLLLENFGLQGQSSYFWSPENPSPLNRGDGPGIYQLDLSGTSTGEVLNPLVEAVLARDARASNRYLRLFFGAPIQRREISFYSVISARNFEPLICQKSVFSRDFDPCSTIFETNFLDMGSRFELFGQIAASGNPWTGYMSQSTPERDNFSIVHAFPVSVDGSAEFIVVVGKPLSEAVERLGDELNLGVNVYNTNRDDSIYSEGDSFELISAKSYLLSALSDDGSIRTLIAPGSQFRLSCKALNYINLSTDRCDTAGTTSVFSLLPLSEDSVEGTDIRLVLSRDISETMSVLDGITISVFAYSLIALALILGTMYLIQRQIFDRLSGAIYVLNELTHGNLSAEAVAKKSIFASETDEIGQLVSALTSYRESLRELEKERSNRAQQRLERELLIIGKMKILADQLDGEAKSLILDDIRNMERLTESLEAGADADENSTKLISLAFARMSDEVLALITARTEEVESARDEANDANLAKSKFLANMSHELRTPLNAIIGYSELLMEEAEDLGVETMAEDLKRITDSGSHLLNLINDILDISKIEAGRLELYISEFDLENTLGMINGLAAPLGEKNNNQIVFESLSDLGLMKNDETRLRQCIINLISNACKFTSNGLVTLTIDSSANNGNEVIVFTVKDTGIGMKKEQLQKIFEEFSQASEDTTSKFGGTGLGLTITKTLVEMMGGSVDVASEEGVGSAFTLRIPRNYESFSLATTEAQEIDDEIIASSKDPLILIIDDDKNIHDIIRRKLAGESLRIISAYNGFDGIKKSQLHTPDLILVDILMPGKDGWNTISEINNDAGLRNIPIVVISTLDDVQTAKSFGAKAFVQKPIDKDILLAHIRTIFENNLDSKSALIIDDDPAARDLAVRMLTGIGFSVEISTNGKEGLEKVREGFDLVLLDLQMPVMDGFEFLEELDSGKHQLAKEPQIIVYSSLLLDEVVSKKLEARCAGMLNKNSINSQVDLENTIKSLVGQQSND
ncbi:response regulator [Gammaproteobacteria bacterium]|nr:response regulator [Gammaproteobacteria bacterium]